MMPVASSGAIIGEIFYSLPNDFFCRLEKETGISE